MIDEKTTYLKLPLPHPDNLLEDDVLRLRETLQGLDAEAKTQDDALKAQSDGLQGVEEELQQQKQDLRDLLAAAVTSAFSPAGSRTSAIAKGTNYTVPAYTVGTSGCGSTCAACAARPGPPRPCTSIRKWGLPGQSRPSSAGTTRSPWTTTSLWR